MTKNHPSDSVIKHEAHYGGLMDSNMAASDFSPSAREVLTFLSGSPERLTLLTELQGHSLSPAELKARADVSEKTTQELLEAGVERDWIVERENAAHYTLTVAGDLVLQAYVNIELLDQDSIAFLATSTTRLRILEYLEQRSLSPVELNERISVADPTVYRALHSLEERDLLDWSQEPKLTTTGVETYEAYRKLAATVHWLTAHRQVLNPLGDVARTLPAYALAQGDTEIIVNTLADPDAVLNHLEDRITALSPERIRGVLPSMCAFIDRMRRPLLDEGAEVDVVIDEAVLDVARGSYPAVLDSAMDAESVELFVYPEKLRFGLMELNSSVFVFAYDEQSLLACFETVSDVLGTWATNIYQTHQRAAYRRND